MSKKYENIIVSSKLDIPYNYYTGKFVGRFYDEIEENNKIVGIKCPKCNTVYMPPRQTCGPCFHDMNDDDFVTLEDEGIVTNYTIVHYEEPALQPMKPPFAYALIKLGGANTPFMHVLGEVEMDKVSIGMKVKAVFNDQKNGNIMDIKYFKPI